LIWIAAAVSRRSWDFRLPHETPLTPPSSALE
jgi:hypothetical protein